MMAISNQNIDAAASEPSLENFALKNRSKQTSKYSDHFPAIERLLSEGVTYKAVSIYLRTHCQLECSASGIQGFAKKMGIKCPNVRTKSTVYSKVSKCQQSENIGNRQVLQVPKLTNPKTKSPPEI